MSAVQHPLKLLFYLIQPRELQLCGNNTPVWRRPPGRDANFAISPKSPGKPMRGWRTDPRAVNGRAGAWRQVRGPYPLRVPVRTAEWCGSEEGLRANLQTLHSLLPSY